MANVIDQASGMKRISSLYRTAAVMVLLSACGLMMSSPANAQAKTGTVLNTSGTYNTVSVSADGKTITVTPAKGTDGKYTSNLNSAAMATFVSGLTAFTCPTYSGSSGGGGGSSSSSGGSVDVNGDGVGDFDTQYEAMQAGYNPTQIVSVNGGSYGDPGTQGAPPRNAAWDQMTGSSSSSSGGSGGGSVDSRVICTHFYRRRRMSEELWRADLEFTFAHLSRSTVRGYQFWAIPYVRWMRRSKFAEAIMFPIARHRAEEIAYQMGLRDKPNYLGKLFRLIIEPACFIIGWFVPEQNWKSLYKENELTVQ